MLNKLIQANNQAGKVLTLWDDVDLYLGSWLHSDSITINYLNEQKEMEIKEMIGYNNERKIQKEQDCVVYLWK